MSIFKKIHPLSPFNWGIGLLLRPKNATVSSIQINYGHYMEQTWPVAILIRASMKSYNRQFLIRNMNGH
jgi:hypothetical protein